MPRVMMYTVASLQNLNHGSFGTLEGFKLDAHNLLDALDQLHQVLTAQMLTQAELLFGLLGIIGLWIYCRRPDSKPETLV